MGGKRLIEGWVTVTSGAPVSCLVERPALFPTFVEWVGPWEPIAAGVWRRPYAAPHAGPVAKLLANSFSVAELVDGAPGRDDGDRWHWRHWPPAYVYKQVARTCALGDIEEVCAWYEQRRPLRRTEMRAALTALAGDWMRA